MFVHGFMSTHWNHSPLPSVSGILTSGSLHCIIQQLHSVYSPNLRLTLDKDF